MHEAFALALPASSSDNEPLYAPERPALPSQTWVIADPNPWLRRELTHHISTHLGGARAGEARSPSEVLTLIADPRCRVLVIDPCMPTVGQSDGMPLLRRIRSLRDDLLVLVLTQHPRHMLRDHALPAGIEHVYAKTVDPAWLCRFIAPALEPRGATPPLAPLREEGA
ncbi:response regulator [Stenotrophomonas sp.]|uniref:response regulator n=1 Tax=Stenotrophomonas sp. TaxID=69392 RepID=UPI002D26BBB8|nr:response regulator [Stenotrophomonas sp.]HYQ22067.1 response regulator [Stenotrophomonas sp.]